MEENTQTVTFFHIMHIGRIQLSQYMGTGCEKMSYGRRTTRGSKKRLHRTAFIVLLVITLFLFLIYILNIRLYPIIKTVATTKAQSIATSVINSAVSQVLIDDKINYNSLMTFEKDQEGKITAVKADSLQINKLKFDISNEINKRFDSIDSKDLNIPLGTILGGQLFTNRGPNIKIKIAPVGNANSELTSIFSSAGINQTRQQVMMKIKVVMTVVMASYNITTAIESNFSLADTVIVGNVPGSYMVVEDGSGSSDKIYMYGGMNKDSSSK